jgi:hypothetical protein
LESLLGCSGTHPERKLEKVPRVFAQHANAGKFHLETRYASKRWEWAVFKQKGGPAMFSGAAVSLESAKQSAAAAIGVKETHWMDIGPAIELAD